MIMEINDFIEKLGDVFEDTDISSLTPQTKFRDLDEWGSMSVLSLIALADEEYGAELEPEDIRKAQTIQDLFELIRLKKD